MKLILILAMAALVSAADYVELTLKDGRKLAGDYDAETGTLSLKLGSIVFKAEEISEVKKVERPAPEPAKARTPEEIAADAAAAAEAERARQAAGATEDAEAARARAAKAAKAAAALATAEANPDLHAVANGSKERLAARAAGNTACRKTYKDADPRLIDQWEDRFELQVVGTLKARQAKAERALAEARRAVK